MNKEEMIKKVSQDSGVSLENTRKVITAFFSTLLENISLNRTFIYVGFGKFIPKMLKARRKISPITKQEMIIPARKTLRLFLSRTLRKQL